jgi:hypothetical protein
MFKLMKNTIIILGLLCLPFWAPAQWQVNLVSEAGLAIETVSQTTQAPGDKTEKPYFNYGVLGYSFYGGIEAQHFFTTHIGFASGLGFSYIKSPDDVVNYPYSNWRSVSIKIPLDMLIELGSRHHANLRFGFSPHINLLQKSPDYESPFTYAYKPVFWSVHAGYYYKPGNRLQVGIMLNRDISSFLKQLQEGVSINGGAETVNFITRHYFFTVQLSLRYRLFEKQP